MRAFLTGTAATIAALALAAACGGPSSDDGPASFGGSSSGGSSSGSSGKSFGGSGAVSTGGGSGAFNFPDAGGGSAGSLSGDACAASSYEGEVIPVDMFIIFDQSGSMNDNIGSGTRWEVIKGALIQFVNSAQSAGMGFGIGYFPIQIQCAAGVPGCNCPLGICIPPTQSSCNANDYARPDVPIELLPQVAPKIVTSLNGHGPNGGTPTWPAMQGAMQYALQYAVQNVGRKTVVVLATDGAPNDCNSNVGNVSQVAAAGFGNNPQLLTFVIGIGNTGNLNQIAQAGGTGQALIVTDAANSGQQFLDAMNKIRGQALSCEFGIPTPKPGEKLNLSEVNVRFTPGGAPSGDIIYHVDNVGACDPNLGGWYYDDPQNPQRILLCPASCSRVTSNAGRIDVELGCKTEIIPH